MVENETKVETDNENSKKEIKQLSPKLDVVFQALFGEKETKELPKIF